MYTALVLSKNDKLFESLLSNINSEEVNFLKSDHPLITIPDDVSLLIENDITSGLNIPISKILINKPIKLINLINQIFYYKDFVIRRNNLILNIIDYTLLDLISSRLIKLQSRECELLQYILSFKNNNCFENDILENVFQYCKSSQTSTLDVYIQKINAKSFNAFDKKILIKSQSKIILNTFSL